MAMIEDPQIKSAAKKMITSTTETGTMIGQAIKEIKKSASEEAIKEQLRSLCDGRMIPETQLQAVRGAVINK